MLTIEILIRAAGFTTVSDVVVKEHEYSLFSN